MSEAKKGSPKIALNMSMVKTIMWDKGPDYTFERVKEQDFLILNCHR